MNKVLILILLFLAFIGFAGGLGYTVYYKGYVIAVGLLAVGYLAWPKFYELLKKLIG